LGYESGRICKNGENGTNDGQGMSGVHLKSRTARAELNTRLGIKCITDVVRRSRLWWFGHVERKDSDYSVSACRGSEFNGVRDRGRGRKTWDECVKKDLVEMGLHRSWALIKLGGQSHIQKPCKHLQRTLNGDDDDDGQETGTH